MPDQEIIIEGDAGFVPKASPSDAGKVLGVLNSSGDVGWVVDQSGTFIQVQADWSETDSSQPSYIDHKPDLSVYATTSSVETALSGKQDTISDLSDIRAGAAKGDTAVQPASLATVATTGDYTDLLNKPSIPAAQVQSDYAQSNSESIDYIKNKPDLSIYAQSANLATVATSGSYSDLSNKPTLPSSDELVPSSTSVDAGKVLTVGNDGTAGWVTPSAGTVYTPGDGIDITSGVISADVDGVTIGIDSTTKKIKSLQTIPTKTSDLQNDSNFVTASSLATVATSGSYADLSNKPTIPSVDQTYNASSTNAQSGTAVAGALATVNQVPSSTSSDENKVLTVNSSGTPVWAVAQGGGSSYTAGDGIEIDNGEISVHHDNTLSVARTYGTASTLEPFSETFYVFETSSDFKGWVANGSAGEYLRVSIPANAFTYATGYTACLGIADDNNNAFYPIQLSATALSNGYMVDAQTVELPLPVGSSTGWEGSVDLTSSNLWLVIAQVQSGSISGYATYYYTRQSMQVAKSNPGGAIAVSNPLPASTSADANKVLTVDSNGAAGWQTPATVTVDQTYNASSTNAQSGTAVAGAIASISVDEVPAVTSSDDGKVLTASYSEGSGSYSWQTASSSGGVQVIANDVFTTKSNNIYTYTVADAGLYSVTIAVGETNMMDVPSRVTIGSGQYVYTNVSLNSSGDVNVSIIRKLTANTQLDFKFYNASSSLISSFTKSPRVTVIKYA